MKYFAVFTTPLLTSIMVCFENFSKKMKNKVVPFFILFLSISSFAQAVEIEPAIFAAVKGRDVEKVRVLINSGADVNQIYKGVSLLNLACQMDNRIVTLLLDTPGINVKQITLTCEDDEYGNKATPLMIYVSCRYENARIEDVVRFIKMGVNINYHSGYNDGGSALWITTHGYQPEIKKAMTIAILKNAGPELDLNFIGRYSKTPLCNSVEHEHVEAVELLLQRGAEVEGGFEKNRYGLIPSTIRHKNHEILDILMEYGANKYGPNSKCAPSLNSALYDPEDSEWAEYFISKYKVDVNYIGTAGSAGDETAMSVAARKNNIAGLNVLFKHGANVNLSNSKGVTAIQNASHSNDLEVAKYLIKKGANLNGYNSDLFNALCFAVMRSNTKMLELLVKNGADINDVKKDASWPTGPLVQCAMEFNPRKSGQRIKTLNKLFKLGADPNVLHFQDKTALMCVAQLSVYDAAVTNCSVLIRKGADVNLVSTKGVTALMIASAAGNIKLVKLLIKKGADVNIVNKMNESALGYAKKAPSNRTVIIDALEKAGAKKVSANSQSIPVPSNVVGTWKGYATDRKIWMTVFVINKNNTYSNSGEYWVDSKRGRLLAGSFSSKGKILFTADYYTIIPTEGTPLSFMYKVVNGQLIIDDGRPRNKIR